MKREDRFNWWLPLLGAVAALIPFFLIVVQENSDIEVFLFNLFVVPSVCLVLIAILATRLRGLPEKRWQSVSIMSIFVAFWAVSWTLALNYQALHTFARWTLTSKTSKAQVLSQPLVTDGEFRHAEWDGWGFAGSDTVVYLVFDPSDLQLPGDDHHFHLKPEGKPCEVWKVQRQEKGWYLVTFYTGTDWQSCR